MEFGKNLISKVKNAFSYAIHGESKDDRDRKAGVAQSVIEFSTPLVTEAGGEERLREVLMKTRTKFLDDLVKKQIAVSIDARLSTQTLGDRDAAIEGVFYPGPQGAAKGGIVALRDDKEDPDQPRQNAVLIEKLSKLLSDVTPNVNVYAYTSVGTPVIGAEGMGGYVPVLTEWASNGNDKAAAAVKNPGLTAPPVKPAAAKPN